MYSVALNGLPEIKNRHLLEPVIDEGFSRWG